MRRPGKHGVGFEHHTTAESPSITADDLRAAHKDGTRSIEVVASSWSTVAEVVDATVADKRAAVADGRLTLEQADEFFSGASAQPIRMIDTDHLRPQLSRQDHLCGSDALGH